MKLRNIIILILISLVFIGCKEEFQIDRKGNFVYQFTADDENMKDIGDTTPSEGREFVHQSPCYQFAKQNSNFKIEENFSKDKYNFILKGNIKYLKCNQIKKERKDIYLVEMGRNIFGRIDLPSNAYVLPINENYIEAFKDSNSNSVTTFILSFNNKELNIYLRNNGLMKKSDKIASVNKKYRRLIKGLALEYDGNIDKYKSSITIYDQYIGVKNWSKESKDSIESFKTKYSKFLNDRRESRLSSLSYDLSKIYETSKDMLYLVSKYHAKEVPSLAKDDYSFSDFALSSLNTVSTLSKRKKLHEKSMNEINKYKDNLLKGY